MKYQVLVHTQGAKDSVIYNFKAKETGHKIIKGVINDSKMPDDLKSLALHQLAELIEYNCPGSYILYEGHIIIVFLLTNENVKCVHGKKII